MIPQIANFLLEETRASILKPQTILNLSTHALALRDLDISSAPKSCVSTTCGSGWVMAANTHPLPQVVLNSAVFNE